MRDLLDKFNSLSKREYEHRESLEKKILIREAQIERLKKKLAKAPWTGWVEGFVEPLAAALSEKVGLPWEIYGPFGLSCNTSIYLREDMTVSICDQETLSITLEPHGDLHEYTIVYRTGEMTDEYQKGSIGWLNGFNCVTAPLPDTLDEIVALLHESGASRKEVPA